MPRTTSKANGSSASFVAVVVGIFFLVTASSSLVQPALTAPDEVVNLAAANAFTEAGSFSLGQALPEDINGVVKPRNIQVRNGQLVPLSYLSFPFALALVGRLAWPFGIWLFTPIVTALALVAYFALVRESFGERRARISLLLLASFPTVLYFTYKALWHNMIFVSLLVLAVFTLRSAARSSRWTPALLLGLLVGAALATRPNEIVWVVALFAVVVFGTRYRLPFKRLIVAAVAGIAMLVPTFVLNAQTFGHPLSFGYTLAIERQASVEPGGSLSAGLRRLIVPPNASLQTYEANTRRYIVGFMPLHLLFFLIGAAAVFIQRESRLRPWFIVAGAGSVWLYGYYFGTVYFGHEQTISEATIGASYLRYLLPAAFLLIPFVAVGIDAISQVRTFRAGRTATLWLITGLLVLSGLALFTFDRSSGLVKYLQKDVPEIRTARAAIVRETPVNAVIIAGRKDKLLFPTRRAVMGYNDVEDRHRAVLPRLLGQYEVFYNDAVGRDAGLWSAEAQQYGFRLESVGLIGSDPLYQFVRQEAAP